LPGKFSEEDLREKNMLRIATLAFLLLSPLRWIYVVDNARCNGCGNCLYSCPRGAISMVAGNAYIDPELCNGCGACVNHCPRDAIYKEWYTGIEENETTARTLCFSSNPAFENSVTVKGAAPVSEVAVFDARGRSILHGYSNQQGLFVIDTADIPEGCYLVVAGEESAVLITI
jgi:ferredoxin